MAAINDPGFLNGNCPYSWTTGAQGVNKDHWTPIGWTWESLNQWESRFVHGEYHWDEVKISENVVMKIWTICTYCRELTSPLAYGLKDEELTSAVKNKLLFVFLIKDILIFFGPTIKVNHKSHNPSSSTYVQGASHSIFEKDFVYSPRESRKGS